MVYATKRLFTRKVDIHQFHVYFMSLQGTKACSHMYGKDAFMMLITFLLGPTITRPNAGGGDHTSQVCKMGIVIEGLHSFSF